MSMFKLTRPGTWYIISKKDGRWNASGHSEVGLFGMPPEGEAKLERLKKELGSPPKDLEYGYMKD